MKKISIFSLILAFLGFLDAAYLTILHYKHIIPPCHTGFQCDTVLTSKYATIVGVPLSLIGVLYYIVLLVLLGLFVQTGEKLLSKLITILVLGGLLVSFVLLYIQGGILGAFCMYCIAVETINILISLPWIYKLIKK